MLIVCDEVDCQRAYHARCIGRQPGETPASWRCPVHFCSHCFKYLEPCIGGGEPSSGDDGDDIEASPPIEWFTCSRCPTSYCSNHRPEPLNQATAATKTKTFVCLRCVVSASFHHRIAILRMVRLVIASAESDPLRFDPILGQIMQFIRHSDASIQQYIDQPDPQPIDPEDRHQLEEGLLELRRSIGNALHRC